MKTIELRNLLPVCAIPTTLALFLGLAASPVWANPITGDFTVVDGAIRIKDETPVVPDQFEFRLGENIAEESRIDFCHDNRGEWVWSFGTTPTDVMSLDSSNKLSLYDLGSSSANPAIVLNPGDPGAAIAPSVMIGDNKVLTVAMDGSFASGYGSSADGVGSTALGHSAQAYGEGSFAGGYWSSANGIASTALGWSEVDADYATAMGYSRAHGLESTAMGSSTTYGGYATAMGSSYSDGYASTALGYSSALADYATALGNSNASGYGSTSSGGAMAVGDYSVAMGTYYTEALEYGSVALGEMATASGLGAVAIGWGSANSMFSVALGGSSHAYGSGSVAIADGQADGTGSFSVGPTVSGAAFTTTIGMYNENRFTDSYWWYGDDQNSVFEVGIGSGDNDKANALTVLQDGSVEVGKDATDGSIPLQVKSDGTVVLAKPQGDISMGIYQ